MQPRGELWFALERICQEFMDYSGLPEKEGLQILISVLANMWYEQKAKLEKLAPPAPPQPPS